MEKFAANSSRCSDFFHFPSVHNFTCQFPRLCWINILCLLAPKFPGLELPYTHSCWYWETNGLCAAKFCATNLFPQMNSSFSLTRFIWSKPVFLMVANDLALIVCFRFFLENEWLIPRPTTAFSKNYSLYDVRTQLANKKPWKHCAAASFSHIHYAQTETRTWYELPSAECLTHWGVGQFAGGFAKLLCMMILYLPVTEFAWRLVAGG